jgi:hypothetical protein
MSSSSIPASLRLFDGDFTLSLAELRKAEDEIKYALEYGVGSSNPDNKRLMIELLATAQHLIASKVD